MQGIVSHVVLTFHFTFRMAECPPRLCLLWKAVKLTAGQKKFITLGAEFRGCCLCDVAHPHRILSTYAQLRWCHPLSPDPQCLCPAEVTSPILTGSSVPMPSWGDVAHPHRILSAYAQLRRPCTTHLQRKPFAQLMIGIAFSGDGEHSDALHPPITSRGKGSEDMMLAQERPSG